MCTSIILTFVEHVISRVVILFLSSWTVAYLEDMDDDITVCKNIYPAP